MIVVVGAGALGSHVAQFLRHEELHLVDFDRVEQKNVEAQFYGRNTVRKLKVEALGGQLATMWGRKCHTSPVKLDDTNAEVLLAGSALVVDCLDNAPGRLALRRWARRPLLHGALAADGLYGQVAWDEEFQIDEAAPGAVTCEDGQHLPFIATVAGLLAHSAQLFLRTGRRQGWQVSPGGIFRT